MNPPQNQNVNNQSYQSDSAPSDVLQSGSALRILSHIRREVIAIMVVVVIFMTVGTVAALLFIGSSTTYSRADLRLYAHGGVEFQYPKQWHRVANMPKNTHEVAFGTNANSNYASALIIEQQTVTGISAATTIPSVKIAGLQARIKQEVNSRAFQTQVKASTQCARIRTLKVIHLPVSSTLRGDAVDIVCSRQGGQEVIVYEIIGLGADNNIYSLEITGLSTEWKANSGIFQAMLHSFKVQS